METIKFELTSTMAIIKKPDSNETYYTYNFPHKIMLFGLLGAIIGLNGYNYYSFQKWLGKPIEKLPEFYEKLKKIKIGIEANIEQENYSRKIQTFNNSVGYASKEVGNNLIVKEQWLEKPSWTIYLLETETEEYKEIKDYLINKKCEYIPYIGKNDHFADIKNVKIEGAEKVSEISYIDSLFEEKIAIPKENLLEELLGFDNRTNKEYLYEELLPVELNEKIGYSKFSKFIYTNQELEIKDSKNIYNVNGKNIYYF